LNRDKIDKKTVRNEVGFLVKRLQQALNSRMNEALAEKGLTISQYAVLAHLREDESLSNAELARRSFVAAPTMIRIVQDLEKLKFLQRTESPSHKKVVDVTLTQKGKSALRSCDSIVMAIQKQMLAGLSAAEVETFARLLVSCTNALNGSRSILVRASGEDK
jgi:DNA-binding MarR family transcriptional regulator